MLEPEEFFDIPGKHFPFSLLDIARLRGPLEICILMTSIAIELAQNPLVRRVIAVLDKNKDGNISFLEFV